MTQVKTQATPHRKTTNVPPRLAVLLLSAICTPLIALGPTPTYGWAEGDEIQYVEQFALADDRQAALAQLIPGTEDYYYYHSLYYQQVQQFERVDQLLEAWIQRHGHTERVRTILNRQALLTYDRQPQKSLEYLRRNLDLRFDHQRQLGEADPALPTTLDQNLISREALLARALASHQNLEGFEDDALEWLVASELDDQRRRDLLRRITRPDHEGLVELVVADLKLGASFGDYPIHAQLLREQLDECAELLPSLRSNSNFVNAYLSKLRPGPDEDWTINPAARGAYLERVWTFVETLPAAFNSLKAQILYHRLVHDRSQGIYNQQLLLQYLQLPRKVYYARPEFVEQRSRSEPLVDLAADFSPYVALRPIVDDEPLVRSYLQHFFVEATSYEPFLAYVKEAYLREVFAETKIIYGLGDAQHWFSWLPPPQVQSLKDRVDLHFLPTNPQLYRAGETVRLEMMIKNVPSLIVKVYEINAGNFYRDQQREVNTDINLDGLTPNWEYTYQYNESPLLRVKRTFEFDELADRGIYVVDFIGNGRSSRALIRKGKLRYVVEPSAGGQVMRVLDENNQHLPDASVVLGGRRFTADDQGEILIPYSTQPGPQPLILEYQQSATLEQFHHAAESYALSAGIYVDREQLLRDRRAKVIVRAGLKVNGQPETLAVLEEVRLRVTSTDVAGVQSTYDVPDFKLHEDRESEFEIQTPPRLTRLDFHLSAKIPLVSRTGEKADVAASETYHVNGIDQTANIEDLHLLRSGDDYRFELLGRTGEPRTQRPVSLSLKHKDFRTPVQVVLKSDDAGQLQLGALEGIESLSGTTSEGLTRTWQITQNRASSTSAVQGKAGEALEIPYPWRADEQLTREDASLLELRDGTFVADLFEALSKGAGVLRLEGLPAGNYDLLLKRSGQHIAIRLTEGTQWNNYVLGTTRLLETRKLAPVRVEAVTHDDDNVRIKLGAVNPFARVHVVATRYVPEFDAFSVLSHVTPNEPSWWRFPAHPSALIEGRNIGDEYRYIIERKFATKFPGNMLERPSLLLNPWPVRTTETSEQLARLGDDMAPAAPAPPSESAPEASESQQVAEVQGRANLDFLANKSIVLTNLVPDEAGEIIVPRSQLGDRHFIQILVVSPSTTELHQLALEAPAVDKLDLRLAAALDSSKHFALKQQTAVLSEGQSLVLRDLASSRLEAYDSVAKLLTLYQTLTSDPTLQEFQFLATWPKLDTQKKKELYSKYACHELHLFLSERDPQFFEQVVRPYLANKREKQLIDDWLLGSDLQDYTRPVRYRRLNTLERLLLAQRLGTLPVATQDLEDRLELIPPDIGRVESLFESAISGSIMNAEHALGLQVVQHEWANLPRPDGAAAGFGIGGLAGAAGRPESRAFANNDAAPEAAGTTQRDRRRSGAENLYFDKERALGRRKLAEQLFQPLDKTREWAENQYYHVPLDEITAELVPPSKFWLDYARHVDDGEFYSTHFPQAGRNLHEVLLAIALLDLPFEPGEHQTKTEEGSYTLVAASPLIAVYEEIQATEAAEEKLPILVSENFFRANDRYVQQGGEERDKFVTDEYLVQEVYGCQVVVTNPTSSRQQLDLLLQIPAGAMPLAKGKATFNTRLLLEPFHTQTIEYQFYFPKTGTFAHYPAHVSREEKMVAHAEPRELKVVERLSSEDRASWQYVSQQGTEEELMAYLREANLHAVNLEMLAWRMQNAASMQKILDELQRRNFYHPTLWSYGIRHNQPDIIRTFLSNHETFVAQSGAYLDSPLLKIDPVERLSYQHLEYRPLVNARAHRLGAERQILNDRFHQQYHRLMDILSCRRQLDDDDLMAVTYYLLLQDRVEEAIRYFGRIDPENLQTRLQYDYFAAYIEFYQANPQKAAEIAARYADYPVDRWRETFAAVTRQAAEISGSSEGDIDPMDRTQVQTQLAAAAPNFELKIEGAQVQLSYQNVSEVRVNYYEMDIELLFSHNPFVDRQDGQFAYIRPNVTDVVPLDPEQKQAALMIPESLHNRNVLVEVVGGGLTRSQTYLSNSLVVQLSSDYGQVRVLDQASHRPLPRVYVKAYAQMQDGSVRFFKDGYTDLRGRFDYASLSTNDLDGVQRFALLVLSDDRGASVRETTPPKR